MDKNFEKFLNEDLDKVFDKSPRDPKRIIRLLKLIGEIWIKAPDMRLCQLIGNCFESGDLYYKEDDVLEKKLRELYQNLLQGDEKNV